MPRLLIAAVLLSTLAHTATAAAQRTGIAHHHRPRSSASALRNATARRRDPSLLALTVAERYWGSTPCGGQVALDADAPVPVGMASGTDAWVSFDSALGANDLAAPASSYTGCTIGIAKWQWPTAKAMRLDWGMFCLTVVHEVGHLLGHPHSLVPGSVMAPVFTNESDVPAICRRNAP